MSWRAWMSRPLFSMRRMISPMSRRRTPSPFTSTRVSSKFSLLLPTDLLAAALVGGAVRARLPLHIEWSPAVGARLLEVPVAPRRDQVVLLRQVAAVRTHYDAAPEFPFERRQLQLALAGRLQVLWRTDDQVDQGPHEGEEYCYDPPEDAHRPAPSCVGVGPVDERDPQNDEQEQHEDRKSTRLNSSH